MKKGSCGAFPMRTGGAQGCEMKKLRDYWCWFRSELTKDGWEPTDTGWLLTLSLFSLLLKIGLLEDGGVAKFDQFVALKPSEMGDTLAGLFSALAFIWIIVTVFMQSRELNEQRKEFETMNATMADQLFETTFFQIIGTLNEIVSSIDLVDKEGRVTTGRDCFSVFYTRFNKNFRKLQEQNHPKDLEVAYHRFWIEHQSELGHYFRFLFRAFHLLREKGKTNTYHAKLLRSQLSDQELLLVFYNSLSEQGKSFAEIATEFELYDNLPTVKLLETEHSLLVSEASFGNNPMKTPKNIRIS